MRRDLTPLTVFSLSALLIPHPTHAASPTLDAANVVWETPSEDSRGSMPLGNGDIGLNVWVEKATGDLVFYISKTDAWGDDVYGSYGLPKVGRVRVHMEPGPFTSNGAFRQTLQLAEGSIAIEGGAPANRVALRVWVDANRPIVHIDGGSAAPEKLQVSIESYRTKPAHGLGVDTVFPAGKSEIAWCYQNRSRRDPSLTNRTFGAVVRGEGLVSADNTTLRSASDTRRFDIRLYPLTAQTSTTDTWLAQAKSAADDDRGRKLDGAYRDHVGWWQQFWDRSWISVSGTPEADAVSKGYARQRFVTACAGRGAYPIKFNGSIFTTDYEIKHRDRNTNVETTEMVPADYRTWGGQYWFQNTRPMYWPLLQSGDWEMMQPLFRMYQGKIPDAEKRVRDYYGHAGAYFAETAPFFPDLPRILPADKPNYTNRYFTPILELSAMMLDYYDYTGDTAFARQTLVPIADEGITFFDQHFPRGADGKLYLQDDNSIETHWKVNNPAPDIAGLRYVIARLLALPSDLTGTLQRARWQRLLAVLPDLPVGDENGKKVLKPYLTADDPTRKNGENPELYAVYPFRLYGLGKPDLQLARDTFAVRKARGTTCWEQDPIHAAYIGDTKLAQTDIIKNFADRSRDTQLRFPVFWGPFHDYSPDEDNGGNGMLGLQLMLLQADAGKLLLLPAWPADWDAEFKLHAPQNTVVEGKVKGGKLISLETTPRERRKDVYLVSPDGTLTPWEGEKR